MDARLEAIASCTTCHVDTVVRIAAHDCNVHERALLAVQSIDNIVARCTDHRLPVNFNYNVTFKKLAREGGRGTGYDAGNHYLSPIICLQYKANASCL